MNNQRSELQGHLFEDRPTDEDGSPIPRLQVLSFGAGQDSTTLLELWLQDEDFRRQWPAEQMLVIFSDTGDEHPSTYEHLSAQEKRLQSRRDTEFAWITPDMGHHRDSWPSLIEHWEESNTIGSKKMPKSCSENLKSSVIYKYLEKRVGEIFGFQTGRKQALYSYAEQFGRIPVMLGIAAGEESRAAGNDTGPKWMQRTVRRIYPLIEMGMDRSDCQNKLRELGADVPRPSLCQHCPFKKEADLLLMKERQPEELKNGSNWSNKSSMRGQSAVRSGESRTQRFGETAGPFQKSSQMRRKSTQALQRRRSPSKPSERDTA